MFITSKNIHPNQNKNTADLNAARTEYNLVTTKPIKMSLQKFLCVHMSFWTLLPWLLCSFLFEKAFWVQHLHTTAWSSSRRHCKPLYSVNNIISICSITGLPDDVLLVGIGCRKKLMHISLSILTACVYLIDVSDDDVVLTTIGFVFDDRILNQE